ncbi:hypothetical protein [Treponema pedis]|uniref:Uncharacterized protein n=1 Tax=Treponema pedis str. T A4 TaxID=1291379 RepID=S6A2J0_9SPIR|nr:hypothetical protein [Treponema pedis]AGT42701.1 hypothetical protein TPE_0205 [Treponema pedis str. T A4]QSI03586.1 hypothetical protein DYQ05_00975 [Treponema pedis]
MKTDVIEKVKYIETSYPVETIEYDGIKLWPFLRSNIFTIYYYSDEQSDSVVMKNVSAIRRIWQAITTTSLKVMFKKNAAFVFTDDVGVKKYNGAYIDRIMYGIFTVEAKTIPCVVKLMSRNITAKDKYINSDFIIFIAKLMEIFYKPKLTNIKNICILDEIIEYLKIDFKYSKYLRSVKILLDFYTWYFKLIKPIKIYVNCYYDFWRLPAFFVAKQMRIPIIEMQHGLINLSNIAYIGFKNITPNPYPTHLFVFGDAFKLSVNEFIYPSKNIFVVGNCYIDLMLRDKNRNSKLFNKKYPNINNKIIITVASQYDIDREILDFTMQTASMDERFFFIFIPRFIKDYHKKFKHANISIETELDVYQCMQNSHITSAVVSTCAVESLAFGTPTVLINIGGLAVFNYADFFSEIHSVLYADTPDEYVQQIYKAIAFDRVSVAEEGKLFFADNYSERLKDAIIKIESK